MGVVCQPLFEEATDRAEADKEADEGRGRPTSI